MMPISERQMLDILKKSWIADIVLSDGEIQCAEVNRVCDHLASLAMTALAELVSEGVVVKPKAGVWRMSEETR